MIYIEGKGNSEGYIFFSNEESLEMPSAAMEECKCSVGIRSDNVSVVEKDSERYSRKKEVQLIICCCFCLHDFLSSHR